MHDDECDKTTYGPEGICTCPSRRDYPDDEPSAATMARMEDYDGPALDW